MGPQVVESCRRITAVVVLVGNLLIPPVPAALSLVASSGSLHNGGGTATGNAAGPPTAQPAAAPPDATSTAALPGTTLPVTTLPGTVGSASTAGVPRAHGTPTTGAPRAGGPSTPSAGTGAAVTTSGAAATNSAAGTAAGTATNTTSDPATSSNTGSSSSGTPTSSTAAGTSTGGESTGSTTVTGADGTRTAAEVLGWGQPTRAEEFDTDLSGWSFYDGPGHAGNGRRTPTAATVSGGVLTINGDADGNSAGMAWPGGSRYGRWEARMRAPVADRDYHAVLLLWPDAENWPVGGEVDFMENSDPTRQRTEFFLHYRTDHDQLSGAVAADAAQWHNWAVEWAPDHITAFLDGQPWWTTTDTAVLPPGPMHMTIQLDLFHLRSDLQPSSMQVDWVHYYPIGATGVSPAPSNAAAPPATGTGTATTPPPTGTAPVTGDPTVTGPTGTGPTGTGPTDTVATRPPTTVPSTTRAPSTSTPRAAPPTTTNPGPTVPAGAATTTEGPDGNADARSVDAGTTRSRTPRGAAATATAASRPPTATNAP